MSCRISRIPQASPCPRARREAIIDLSKRYGFVIMEDDVYRDIRFVDALPPSFYALAAGKQVLRLGSFSKTLGTGYAYRLADGIA